MVGQFNEMGVADAVNDHQFRLSRKRILDNQVVRGRVADNDLVRKKVLQQCLQEMKDFFRCKAWRRLAGSMHGEGLRARSGMVTNQIEDGAASKIG